MVINSLGLVLARMLHILSLVILVGFTAFGLGYTLACSLGFADWLVVPLTFGSTTIPEAGIIIQIVVTAAFSALMFFVPGSLRTLALENSHRSFQISMNDVAKAYHHCHAADRQGVFTLSSEFDAVRERLTFLRDHPELERIEGDLLTIAAQMSQQSKELASIYSDEKVARARAFLRQRQQEVEEQQARILEAQHICSEIRAWADQITAEETAVSRQLDALDTQLQAVLPKLGYGFEMESVASNVVTLPAKPAAE